MTYKEKIAKIDKAIVDGWKRGVCTDEGGHVPLNKRGRCGKGDGRFDWVPSEQYRRNYDRIFSKG